MSIYILSGFAENIGKSAEPSTVDNASVVAVTVPASVNFATIAIYNFVQKTVIDVNGASYDNSYEPVTSIVLPTGVHLIRKAGHQYVGATSGDKIFATAVREPK